MCPLQLHHRSSSIGQQVRRVSTQKHCFFFGFRGIGACSYWEEWIDGISSDTGADSEVLVAPWRGLREQEEQDHPLPACHVQGFSSCGRPGAPWKPLLLQPL
jgi:hypothetical protein